MNHHDLDTRTQRRIDGLRESLSEALDALARIRDARDRLADGDDGWIRPDQAFDDWAADLADSVLDGRR